MDQSGVRVTFRADRTIVPYEASSNPELEPLFANHLELIHLNGDVFLDIGVITPQELIQAVQTRPNADDILPVKFYVLQRVVMSIETLNRFRDKLNEIHQNLGKGELPESAQTEIKAIE